MAEISFGCYDCPGKTEACEVTRGQAYIILNAAAETGMPMHAVDGAVNTWSHPDSRACKGPGEDGFPACRLQTQEVVASLIDGLNKSAHPSVLRPGAVPLITLALVDDIAHALYGATLPALNPWSAAPPQNINPNPDFL